MAVNKIVLKSGKVLIDLSALTITPEDLREGVIGINVAGEIIVGTHKCGTDTIAKLGVAVLGKMKLGVQ